MASSGNFCTLNPSLRSVTAGMNGGTFSLGNLKYAMSGEDGFRGNYAMTHKTYCEVYINSISNFGGTIGFGSYQNNRTYEDMITFQTNYQSGKIYHYKGSSNESVSIADIGGTVSATDVIMMAYDPATYKWWVGVNGTWRNSGDPANGTGFVFQGSSTMFEDMQGVFWAGWKGSANGLTCHWNFGQDSTFAGTITAGGNADDNGFGDFKYSPPTGFLALCSGNQVISDDIDPAQTDDNYPSKNFNTVLYTGNDGAQSVTGVGFKPDLVWIKARNSAQHYAMFDSSRGALKRIGSSRTNAEDTDSSFLSSFDTDGFSWSTGGDNTQNGSYNYVSWCWKANGGTTATNNDGSITSTVQANDKAGFSIITWTASGANGSIGHGLSAKPDWHIIKKRNDTSGWAVYHKSLGATKYYRLDTNSSASTFQYTYNNTEPDATKIYLGDNGLTNHPSGDTYVCYAWREVEGYSKFGTYTANGNSDGPFIYTGFRPRMLFIRRYSGTDSSFVIDTARETKNVNGDFLFWDSNQTESSSSLLDILSNGFKLRTTSASLNPSGTELIWGAWGDVPFKYNNTF